MVGSAAVPPSQPTVRVAVLDTPARRFPLGHEFDLVDLVDDVDGSLMESDLVVLTSEGLAEADRSLVTKLGEWSRLAGTQRVVLWFDDSQRRPAGRAAVPGFLESASPLVCGEGGDLQLRPMFDPRIHNPIGWKMPGKGGWTWSEETGLLVARWQGQPLLAVLPEGQDPDLAASLAGAGAILLSPGHRDSPLPLLEGGEEEGKQLLAKSEFLVRFSVATRRAVHAGLTTQRRAAQLLEAAGVPARPLHRRVAGLLISNKPAFLPPAIRSISAQTHRPFELVIGLHGIEETPSIVAALAAADRLVATSTMIFPADMTLGECLNRAAESTSAEYLAKFDDDDYYGPHYIEDAVQALEYSNAEVVGKARYYMYLKSADRTVLLRSNREEQYVGHVLGATLLVKRSLWETVGFPHRPQRVDTLFLRAARAVGARMYSNHRYEFVVSRRIGGHTWEAEDELFVAASDEAWDGNDPERSIARFAQSR